MAKAIAVPSERPESKQPSKQNQQPGQLAGTWERSTGFLKDVRNEMRKVSTPSRKEVQATTGVVIVTVFVFAAYFYVVDGVLSKSMSWLLNALGAK
jgi:preprotein translocase subunit SecE